MRPLNALQQAVSTAVREPIVLGVAALVALLQIPILLSQLLPPVYAVFASLGANLLVLLLSPFTQGGMLGLADSALDGEGDVRTFLSAGREHYVSLFAAFLVLFAVNTALVIATLVLLLVLGTGFGALAASANGAPGIAIPGGVGAVGVVVVAVVGLVALLYLLAFLFIQFYAQAIVVDDYSAVESFKRSASLVRQHFVSTLGYSLVALLVGGTAGVVIGVSSTLLGSAPDALQMEVTWPALIAGILLLVVVLSTVVSAFTSLYSVAFYRDISPTETGGVSQL
jgi:hypothetical protein